MRHRVQGLSERRPLEESPGPPAAPPPDGESRPSDSAPSSSGQDSVTEEASPPSAGAAPAPAQAPASPAPPSEDAPVAVVEEPAAGRGPATEEVSDLLGRLQTSLREQETLLHSLQSQFTEKIKDDAGKLEMFKILHSELRQYRENMIYQMVLKPHYLALAALYDDLSKTISHLQPGSEELSNYLSFRAQLEGILAAQHVTRFGELGERFDARIHDCRATSTSSCPEEDSTIGAVLQAGFRYRDQILRHAKVDVNRYDGQGKPTDH